MKDRIADPRALGFAAFAILAWMYSMITAGWFGGASVIGSMTGVATFAWLALLVAGFAAFLRGDSWHATFFMLWSALIWGFRVALQHGGMANAAGYGGWYNIAIAVVSFFLFLAALRAAVGIAVVLVSAGFTLTFVFSALGHWFGGSFWIVIAGYLGLLTGLASFWAMAVALVGPGGEPVSAASSGGMGA